MSFLFSGAMTFGAMSDSRTATVGEALPRSLESYRDIPDASLWDVLAGRASADPFNIAALAIFVGAIAHTFLAARFRHCAHAVEARQSAARAAAGAPTGDADGDHPPEVNFAGQVLHFFGKIEAVFGIWAILLGVAITWFKG
jgi:hypothetical protein